MASRDVKRREPTASNEGKNIDLSMISEEMLAEMFKKQITLPPNKYYDNTPFSDYIDMNPLFFSKIESLEESEKTGYLLSCLDDESYNYLKLSRPNTVLAKCKYADLVEDLINYSAETKKYAKEYSKLLFIDGSNYSDMKSLHRYKVVEWRSFEELIAEKIPDLVKVLFLFEEYKEPYKSLAERYIQDNHSDIKLESFIQYMETESLFLKEFQQGGQRKPRRGKKR